MSDQHILSPMNPKNITTAFFRFTNLGFLKFKTQALQVLNFRTICVNLCTGKSLSDVLIYLSINQQYSIPLLGRFPLIIGTSEIHTSVELFGFFLDFFGEFFGGFFWEDFLGGFIFGRNSLFILLKSAKLFESERD